MKPVIPYITPASTNTITDSPENIYAGYVCRLFVGTDREHILAELCLIPDHPHNSCEYYGIKHILRNGNIAYREKRALDKVWYTTDRVRTSVWPLFVPIIRYIRMIPKTISCVERVTMKGCSLNFATKNPFTRPISSTYRDNRKEHEPSKASTPRSGNILFDSRRICRRDAAIQAVSPTARPAEISVPVSTIAPRNTESYRKLCRRQRDDVD